jgi:transcriptional regulator with XRE-family HTH domain
MAGGVSPVVRGRRLAAVLRGLRTESGRTIEEVAARLECSAAKISRIENGLVGVRIQDARELLDLYQVHGERREELLELVRQARGRGWWLPYADVVSEGYDRVLGFEDEATVIQLLETRLIPGLLQTERYATALFAAPHDVSADVQERRIRLRMERQKILEREQPPLLDVLLDEAALRRRIGTAEVMAEQCGHLTGLARRPNVSLRVLPLDGETHQAAGFAFTVFGFADPGDPKVVYEELYKGTVWQESAELVGRYTAAFDQARGCALGEAQSLAFLADLAKRPA